MKIASLTLPVIFATTVVAALLGCGGTSGSNDPHDNPIEDVTLHADSFCGTNPFQLDGEVKKTFNGDSAISFLNTETNVIYPAGNETVGADGKSLTGTAPANMPPGQYNVLVSLTSNPSPTNIGLINYDTGC